MDRKTLEYMEERAKKARRIVARVETLANNLKKIQKVNRCFFDNGAEHGYYTEEKEHLLVEKIKEAYVVVIVEEIERLEQELAEL
ncbi:hypothetical protein V7114_20730 [Neobacillus niacini]|uniref:hypothetical protein n=1 Tax=Neobacillus niacini TaxID=86668 RepID=UPI002FFE44FD